MSVRGRRLSLSPARRLIGDLMHASRDVPVIPMERRMHLAPLVAARNASPVRIGWCAVFTKAFSLVAARRPELRRAYLNFPWGHLYEHDTNVASIAIERRMHDEDAVLFAKVRSPEQLPLRRLQAEIDRAKHEPIESIRAFRRELQLARLPTFLRRFVWWNGLQVSGPRRARQFGTFGISTIAAFGASQLLVHSPLTTTLYYSPFDTAGSLDMRLVFDHRVLDGATVARALAEMERALLDEILLEVERNEVKPAVDHGLGSSTPFSSAVSGPSETAISNTVRGISLPRQQ